jgi:hypothetical protein
MLHNMGYTGVMSPKQRFPVMLDPQDLEHLKATQARTGASIGEQIRRAVKAWIAAEVTKAPSRRVSPRRKGSRQPVD